MANARQTRRSEIVDLATHRAAYVTPSALAKYWGIRVRDLIDCIEAGRLSAVRFDRRVFRIKVIEALAFEREETNKGSASLIRRSTRRM